MTDIAKELSICAEKVQTGLARKYEKCDNDLEKLLSSEKYSLFNAGKRIRPFLTLEFCKLFGGKEEDAMDFALALEMIHTFSLIHDDLPCMDNDDLRRGKPTNHKVYGEDIAMLAGDAMLTKAFETMTDNKSLAPTTVLAAIRLLATSSGNFGMAGGQAMDLAAENTSVSFEYLLKLHSLKTGALIGAAAKLGCLAAGFDEDTAEYRDASAYAEKVGLAFQVIDDILDVEGDAALLGKNTGSDAENSKTTFLSFMSLEDAKKYATELSEEAVLAIKKYENSETLISLVRFLLARKY